MHRPKCSNVDMKRTRLAGPNDKNDRTRTSRDRGGTKGPSPPPPRRPHGEGDGDPPRAPSPPHPPLREPSLAERSVRRLVVDSRFFPPEAADDGWFRRRPSGDDDDDDDDDGDVTPARDESGEGARARCVVAALDEREVRVGELLGRGGFCEVRTAHLEGSGGGGDPNAPYYAVKYLSPTLGARKGGRAVVRGAADLAIEARFLSLLRHDNIVGLHGVRAAGRDEGDDRDRDRNVVGPRGADEGGPAAQFDCGKDEEESEGRGGLGYFLILDRLEETLDRRIKSTFIPEVERLTGYRSGKRADAQSPRRRWSGSLPRWTSSPLASSPTSERDDPRPSETLRSLLAKRLTILRAVASAIKHLHDRRILFRDLKPDNVGFHRDGAGGETPKLYDFGLARELKSSDQVSSTTPDFGGDAVYKLTGRTGSQRYMCPEVAFSHPYNRKADVYSFGMVLYELSTLVQPFEGYNVHRHEVEVLRGGGRPPLPPDRDDCWPGDLASLIEECWSGDMRERPGIDEVTKRLDGCIDDLLASFAAGADETSRRAPRTGAAAPSPLSSSSSSGPPGADSGPERKIRGKMRQFLPSVPAAANLMQRRRGTR